MQSAEVSNPELIVHAPNGIAQYWKPDQNGKIELTYVVLDNSFPDSASLRTFRRSLKQAVRDWERACRKCKIKFREVDGEKHRNEDGVIVPSSELTFVAGYVGHKPYLASAFFPNWSYNRRYLRISAGFFGDHGFSRAGIMRHELAHVLGYRHEHIDQGPKACAKEGSDYIRLSPPDWKSVTSYLCGGAGTRKMKLSKIDKRFHRRLYLGELQYLFVPDPT